MTNPSERTTLEETILAAAQSARRLSPRLRTLVWASIAGVVLMIVVGITLFCIYGKPVTNSAGALFLIGLFGLLLVPVVAVGGIGLWNRQNAWCRLYDLLASEPLTDQDSLSGSSIGPLLEVILLGENERCLQPSVALLSRLLKSVQAGQEVALTADQRRLLHTLVIQGRWDWLPLQDGHGLEMLRCDLCPAAVGALGILGDPSSIPILERFARRSRDPDLRASALGSVAQIRERMRYGPEQLLRADAAPQQSDTLLRPASGHQKQNSDPQQLLRADQADSER